MREVRSMSSKDADIEFASAYTAALHEKPSRAGTYFIIVLGVVIGSFLAWANWAKIDEVTRGDGRIIPSGKNQVVQSLEGGVVKQILVKPGASVHKGDLLLRIDDTGFASSLWRSGSQAGHLARRDHSSAIRGQWRQVFAAEFSGRPGEAGTGDGCQRERTLPGQATQAGCAGRHSSRTSQAAPKRSSGVEIQR